VGFAVVYELPLRGVPAELAVVPVGQVAEVADGHRAGADLHVADRPLPRADAVQPIALVAGRLVKVHVFFAERRLDDLAGPAFQETAIDDNLAVAADEVYAALFRAAVDHLHAIGVDVTHAVVGLGVFRWNDLARARFVHSQAPLGDIEVVGAPVGHHAAGVFAVVAPRREVVVNAARAEHRVVGPLRGRAKPAIPIETRLQLLL